MIAYRSAKLAYLSCSDGVVYSSSGSSWGASDSGEPIAGGRAGGLGGRSGGRGGAREGARAEGQQERGLHA